MVQVKADVPPNGPRDLDAGAPAGSRLLLLVTLVASVVTQPLLTGRGVAADLLTDAVLGAICFYMLFIIFRARWERRAAVVLFVAVFATGLGASIRSSQLGRGEAIAFHCVVALFWSFAVIVILRDLFRQRVIRGDDVIGGICGYILAALVWSHVYALTFLLKPSAFSVNPVIGPQLDNWYLRRTLFDYLSFTTLTSLGNANLTPAGPPMYTLTWLEVVFSQFYMAVVVAQLVGLKLAQAIRRDDEVR